MVELKRCSVLSLFTVRCGMDPIPEIAALRKAVLTAKSNFSSARLEAVQEASRAATARLQAAGWPVEAIIVQLKSDIGYAVDAHHPDEVSFAAIRASIEHYYRTEP